MTNKNNRFWKFAPAAGWVACVAVAIGLVWVGPNERQFMGQMPPLAAKARDQSPVLLPQQMPQERTLALLVFNREQRAEARTWIDGMGLRDNPGIPWMKVQVVSTGAPLPRPASLTPVAYAAGVKDPWLAVATDVDGLVQALGFTDRDHAQLVVVDRNGNVLAKAQGSYDPAKADALLATLLPD